MKVKHIFCNGRESINKATALDTQINDFIRNKKVIDIKYSSSLAMAATNYGSGSEIDYSALIIYEED
ncbi:hypothetical protein ACVR1I_08670 [Streptococcus cameli]